MTTTLALALALTLALTLTRCGAFIGVAMSVALFYFGPAALMALTRKAPD